MKADDAQLQVVLVMPGGQFFGAGLIELANVDALLACLATLDTRGGHVVSPIDIQRAYNQARALQPRGDAPANNDADDDCA